MKFLFQQILMFEPFKEEQLEHVLTGFEHILEVRVYPQATLGMPGPKRTGFLSLCSQSAGVWAGKCSV